MPDLIGKDRDEAIRELTKLNLDGSVVGEVEVTDEKLVGKIAWTSHAYGTSVAEGTKIQLKVGKLKEEKVFVDRFIKVGMKASDAKEALEAAGFTKVVINGDNNGVVVRWDPTEKITKSTKVTIFSGKAEEPAPPTDSEE